MPVVQNSASVSPNACIVLHERDLSLVLDVTNGHLPAVVHWGARIENLSAADAAVLLRPGSCRQHRTVSTIRCGSLCCLKHWSGWVGRPGLSGSRSGVAWSPKFTTTALRVDGAQVPPDQTVENRRGPALVSVDAVDDDAELELRVDVEMLPDGLVRAGATLTNRGGAVRAGRSGAGLPGALAGRRGIGPRWAPG